MKNYNLIWIIAIAIVLASSAHSETASQSLQNKTSTIPLRQYLLVMGAKLNCYFTLERDDLGVHKIDNFRKESRLRNPNIEDDEKIVTIKELITKLKTDFPEAEFSTNVINSRGVVVIHIADASLRKVKDYVLDQKLTITYAGSLNELPNAMGLKLQNRISSPRVLSLPMLSKDYVDYTTRINIDTRDLPTRDILTAAVTLPTNSRILWDAEARTQDGGDVVWVNFFK